MTTDKDPAPTGKPHWEKPRFERLGTLRDIAGPMGVGLQAGPNSRS